MKIKIIWDFRGEHAKLTAKHHAIHLKEFCDKHNIQYTTIDIDTPNDYHSIAYIVTSKEHTITIRDALKPHRAVVVD